MNTDMKKIIDRVKTAQSQLQTALQDKTWVENARKYAERQGKEVRKLLTSDVSKVKAFLERERKELERFQKQLPGEVKKFRKFVDGQKKEIEKLLKNVRKASKASAKKSGAKKATGTKKKTTTKKAATASSEA